MTLVLPIMIGRLGSTICSINVSGLRLVAASNLFVHSDTYPQAIHMAANGAICLGDMPLP